MVDMSKYKGKRKILLEQPPAGGADGIDFLARQMDVARPVDLAGLYMLRNDQSQREAMNIMQQAKTAVWTRRAVFAAVLSVPLNGLVTFLVTRC